MTTNDKLSVISLLSLAEKYEFGIEGPKDYIKAMELYNECANQNNSYALCNIGTFYEEGKGVSKDYYKAIEYYKKAANLNNDLAYYNLARLYENGLGVPKIYTKAFDLYEKSYKIAKGYYAYEAMLRISNKLKELGKFEFSTIRNSLECKNIINKLYKEKNYPKLIDLLEFNVYLGNTFAMNFLGDLFMKGEGIEKDILKATELYIESAQQNDSDGSFKYGLLIVNNPKINEEKIILGGITLIEKAISLNNAEAMFTLACWYAKGNIVEKNISKAAELYKKAANLNHSMATLLLADMYVDGIISDSKVVGYRDFSKAEKLYIHAIELGNLKALESLKNLYEIEKNKGDSEAALKLFKFQEKYKDLI